MHSKSPLELILHDKLKLRVFEAMRNALLIFTSLQGVYFRRGEVYLLSLLWGPPGLYPMGTVKLSHCLTKHYAMKAYGGVYRPTFS
jgi:hypothetical protein